MSLRQKNYEIIINPRTKIAKTGHKEKYKFVMYLSDFADRIFFKFNSLLFENYEYSLIISPESKRQKVLLLQRKFDKPNGKLTRGARKCFVNLGRLI